MTAGAGWPMGPFRLIDLVGIDVHVHAAEALHAALPRAAHGAAAAAAADARRRSAGPQDGPGLLRLRCGGVSPGANAPELTKSLPPQHRTVTSRMDNPDMRLPSDQRAPVSRGVVLRAVLAAVLAALTIAPIADAAAAAKGDTGLFVSKGVGRQIFTGGGGVCYGIVFSGGSLVVADFSADARRARRLSGGLRRSTRTARAPTFLLGGTKAKGAWPSSISGSLPRDRDPGLERRQRRRRLRAPAGAGQGHAERQRREAALEQPARQHRQGPEGPQEALPVRPHGRTAAGSARSGSAASSARHDDHDDHHDRGHGAVRQLSAPGCGRTASLE